ncbi:MAG: glycosyltransferase [Ekhidna sp.]|nr:glycosyltransferase [Ekhidna sp.]
MNQLPLVSIICLCHNQKQFVAEAINSVKKQSYPNIELIVVDDGSTDGSKEEIEKTIDSKTTLYINIPKPVGNCIAFNRGFFQSSGKYIIDLAADDCLLPERVLVGINAFLRTDAGVTFCDVLEIDEDGNNKGTHYARDRNDKLIDTVPDGEIYIELIKKYFISPPSMMIKREVFEELNGYDESLSYEDFDFWIRSSRKFRYAFTDEILVRKRIVSNSLSTKQFVKKSIHQMTTLKVCQKIKHLNKSKEENRALKQRCLYEIKQCIKLRHWSLIPNFWSLIQ